MYVSSFSSSPYFRHLRYFICVDPRKTKPLERLSPPSVSTNASLACTFYILHPLTPCFYSSKYVFRAAPQKKKKHILLTHLTELLKIVRRTITRNIGELRKLSLCLHQPYPAFRLFPVHTYIHMYVYIFLLNLFCFK